MDAPRRPWIHRVVNQLTRPLWNMLQRVKKPFLPGGRLHRLYPLYEAIETFLFQPPLTTPRTGGVHIRAGNDLKRVMITVVIALIPPTLFGIWNIGHQFYVAQGQWVGLAEGFLPKVLKGLEVFLPMLIVSYAVGGTIEVLFAIIRRHPVSEGFLVTGLLIPLIMPPTIPLWILAIATAFAVIFGKEIFGGTGMNVVNTALLARAFVFFAYPTVISGDAVWVVPPVDGFTKATPLAAAVISGADALSGRAYAPYGFSDLFWGWIPGSIGETCKPAILLGGLLLLVTGVASWRIMLGMLLGGAFMAWIFNLVGNTPLMQVPWIYHLVMGGFLFGLVYMATDPVTAATTNPGKWIYGFLAGAFAMIIRVVNPAYPEGVMLAILLMNVTAPLIDYLVLRFYVRRRLTYG